MFRSFWSFLNKLIKKSYNFNQHLDLMHIGVKFTFLGLDSQQTVSPE